MFPNGNLISDGTNSYTYDVENRMVSASNGATLAYDPLGRLWRTGGGAYGKTDFLYDGDQVVSEYDGDTGGMRRRYMWGANVDEPILWDEGGSMNCTGTRFLHTNAQGSVIALADCSGNLTQVNSYDEFGIPAAGNYTPALRQRFQYTGQSWIPELGMYYYKARIYSPTLGRFMQTDPIGYGDGINFYNYVGGDPVNNTDPSGLDTCPNGSPYICVTARKKCGIVCFFTRILGGGGGGTGSSTTSAFGFSSRGGSAPPPITIPRPPAAPAARPTPATQAVTAAPQSNCPAPQTTAGKIAALADTIGEGADTVAIASGTLGLITAPTGAGFVIFEGTALLAGGVGRLASGVSIVANLVDGNVSGAAKGAVSLIGGSAAGFATKGLLGRSIASGRIFKNLSASQRRVTNVAGDGVAAGYGRLVGRIGC